MEKITFLWSDSKNWGNSVPLAPSIPLPMDNGIPMHCELLYAMKFICRSINKSFVEFVCLHCNNMLLCL